MPRRALAYHRVAPAVSTLVALLVLAAAAPSAASPLPPDAWFGRPVGGDGVLIPYDDQVGYFEHLAAESPRIRIESAGKSTEGRDLILVIASSPGNLLRIEEIREIAARLDDPRGLGAAEIDSLARRGRGVVAVAFNIHSDEIASSQTALGWVHHLAVTDDPEIVHALDELVVLVIPSLNPDGQMAVHAWREETRGTAHHESPLPRLYHPYAGHDNNRDWFMLNLAETRAWHRALYRRWYPQVLVDHHQMGPHGPRMFVPPYTDPVTEHVHPLVHRYSAVLGSTMALRLEREGRAGVIQGFVFDAYWPGGTRSTPWWKNTFGILTETASARGMSPLRVAPDRLRGGGKGLLDYQRQVNFPNPWPGGLWRARDILDYEATASDAVLVACAALRPQLLADRARMALDAVHQGEHEHPRGWLVPSRQHDSGRAEALIALLLEHGVEVRRSAEDPGTYFIPAAQPYRPFLLEMLGEQRFRKVRRVPDDDGFLPPYDVTSWSLPLMTGVPVEPAGRVPSGSWIPVASAPATPALPPGAEAPRWVLPGEFLDNTVAALRLAREGHAVMRGLTPRFAGDEPLEHGWFEVRADAETMGRAFEGLRGRALPAGESATRGDGQEAAGVPLRLPRIAVLAPWGGNADAGWIHFVLDAGSVPHRVLAPEDLCAAVAARELDVVLLPDAGLDDLVEGTGEGDDPGPTPAPPPSYRAGIGHRGVELLDAFVRDGGTLIALGRSTALPLRTFDLPLREEAPSRRRDRLSTPGSALRVEIDRAHPLAFGMPASLAVFRTDAPVFRPAGRGRRDGVVTVARFPDRGELLLSGHGEGLDALRGASALAAVEHGKGRVILFGFRPQHRGQTWVTRQLLYNALFEGNPGTDSKR